MLLVLLGFIGFEGFVGFIGFSGFMGFWGSAHSHDAACGACVVPVQVAPTAGAFIPSGTLSRVFGSRFPCKVRRPALHSTVLRRHVPPQVEN